MIRGFWLCIILVCSFAQSAFAHTRSQSFSTWDVEGQEARFVFAVDALRITQLGTIYPDESDPGVLLRHHVTDTVTASQNGQTCHLDLAKEPDRHLSVYRLSGRLTCPEDILRQPVEVDIKAFFPVSPTHIHLVRLGENLGDTDIVLRDGRSDFVLAAGGTPQSLFGFMSVGFFHVLSGLDHLLFLVGLALVARQPRLAIFCITGFTLGHTASLGLATYGLILPDSRLVEALIGFTIAIMALEAYAPGGALRRKAFVAFGVLSFLVATLPIPGGSSFGFGVILMVYVLASGFMPEHTARNILPVLTIVFGLIHGAGFAGGLQELSLSQANLVVPLIGFNIGVELAQLLALVCVYVVMMVISRMLPRWSDPVELGISLIIFGAGCFWFAQRLWM